jgi:hypothetical protein
MESVTYRDQEKRMAIRTLSSYAKNGKITSQVIDSTCNHPSGSCRGVEGGPR